MEQLNKFLHRNGIATRDVIEKWSRKKLIFINQQVATLESNITANDQLDIRGIQYRVTASNDPDRLSIQTEKSDPNRKITSRIRVHCGLHKCLTMYVRRVYKKVAYLTKPSSGAFRHFYHRLDEFYNDCDKYVLSSISGHGLDLDRFEDIRVVRFIRDPRDLLISGYFYHKIGSEDWCKHINPTEQDWAMVNGNVPEKVTAGQSLTKYLNEVSLEEGLFAELEFRKHHFDSMLKWSNDDPRVLTFRYEDIIGNEVDIFRNIFDFYKLPFLARQAGLFYVHKYSAAKKKGSYKHIRDPGSGQWKNYFTPALEKKFNDEHGELLAKLAY